MIIPLKKSFNKNLIVDQYNFCCEKLFECGFDNMNI